MKCVSLTNQPGQATSTLVDIKSNGNLFYPFTIWVNNCCGSCSTIDDPYARVCVSNKVKNIDVNEFDFMSGINETRLLVQHESCEYKCGLNESVCNSNQKWNHDKIATDVKN